MPSLAKSPLAPVLGKHVPLRGPARLLYNSYARTRYLPQQSVTRVTTATGDVFDADLSSTLEWQLWAFGSYEPHFAELFALLVRPGDRCVDVGANVGVHTVRLARLAGPDGEVIAIEPDPGVIARAGRNVALNNLSNVRLRNAAASDKPGEMRLYRPGEADTNRARASLLRHAYLTGEDHDGSGGDRGRRLRRGPGRADQDRRGRARGRRGPRRGPGHRPGRAGGHLRVRGRAARRRPRRRRSSGWPSGATSCSPSTPPGTRSPGGSGWHSTACASGRRCAPTTSPSPAKRPRDWKGSRGTAGEHR